MKKTLSFIIEITLIVILIWCSSTIKNVSTNANSPLYPQTEILMTNPYNIRK